MIVVALLVLSQRRMTLPRDDFPLTAKNTEHFANKCWLFGICSGMVEKESFSPAACLGGDVRRVES